jgi:hypothetical protein
MASLYTQYTIHGLVFTFNSTSAVALNSTNTNLGTVVMATQYNTYDSPFRTKMEMENHEFCTSVKPSECAMHPVECKVSETPFRVHFTRTGALSASEDERLYDWGRFSLATVGMQASAIIGELWVSYDVEFEKPRVNNGTFGNSRHARVSNAQWNHNNPLGIIQTGVGGNMGLTVSATGAGWDTVNFDPNLTGGRFLLNLVTDGTGMSGGYTLNYVNCKLADDGWQYNLVSPKYESVVTIATESIGVYLIEVTGPAASIQLTAVPSHTTALAVDVLILQVPGAEDFPITPPPLYSKQYVESKEAEWERLERTPSDFSAAADRWLRHATDSELQELHYKMSRLALRDPGYQG